MTEPEDRQALESAVAAGARPEFLFFWGHRPPREGRITASCLSQWYASPFTLEGIAYPTAEHFMMASKARLFEDADTLAAILEASHPRAAKALGRQVHPFERARWKEHRFRFVVAGNEAKFRQNPDLGDFLRSTRRRILVEASPYDPIWGIGLGRRHPDAPHPARWRGQNLLGFALMEVRRRLLD